MENIDLKLVDQRLNKFFEVKKQTNDKLNAIGVGIVSKGVLGYTWFAGTLNKESEIKVAEDTLFGCASITKSFTALLTLILRDESKLNLDDKLKNYFPGIKNPKVQEITIRSLLGMASGLQRDVVERWDGKDMPLISAILEEFETNTEPILESYQKFHYSNIGYTVLGHILSSLLLSNYQQHEIEIENKPYTELISTRILNKLSMDNSTFEMYQEKNKKCEASSYFYEGAPCPKVKYNACAPCGGLMSSINDLVKYLNFMIKGNCDIISDNSLRELISPIILTETSTQRKIKPISYGMGWFLGKYDKYNIVFHTGQFQGFISLLIFIRELDFGLIIWENSDTSIIYDIGEGVLEIIVPLFQQLEELKNYQLKQEISKNLGEKIVYEHVQKSFNVLLNISFYQFQFQQNRKLQKYIKLMEKNLIN